MSISGVLMSESVLSRRSLLLATAGAGLGGALALAGADGAFAYSASTTAGYPVLRQGSRGTAVRVVQGVAASGVDGVFGPNTRAKVVAFQRSKGLGADGIVGKNTWAAMLGTVRKGSRGSTVKGLQAGLGGLSVDGVFGSGTDAKVRAFQKSRGLVVDGIAGPATWAALVGASAGSRGPNPRTAYNNGRLPEAALASVGYGGFRLSRWCVADYKAMNAAFRSRFGINLPISGSMSAYRTYDQQVYLWNLYQSGKGNKAARPGTSNHGWGLAADISVGGYGSAYYSWLRDNAPTYGFRNDVSGEPWHWGYQR